MSLEKETKNHFDQIRDRNKNGHKRKDHSKRMNEGSTQYIKRLVTNDHINEINFQRYNSEEKLNEEKQNLNDTRT